MESELQDVAAEAARELAQHGLDGPAPRHVAALAKSMQAFQRALYGAAAVAQVARVPARLFRDLSPRGSLFAIVVTVALLRRDRAWDDRAAFGVPGNEAADMQDLWSVVHNLQQAGYWSPPRILLADGVPASERPSLEMIVKRLQGSLVADAGQDVTHIVRTDAGVSQPPKSHLSVVGRRGSMVLVHHWRKPDSADEWLPAASSRSSQPHTVTSQWLIDSNTASEWMNEQDYETADMDTFDPTASLSPADSTLAFGGGGSSGTFRTGSGAGMNSELSRTDSRNALRASLRSESVADMDSNFGGAHDDDDDDDMADTSLMTGVYSSNSDIISFPPVGPDTRPPARISVTGFERRLPSKIKRHEYEPIPGGILLNISAPALTRPRDWLGSRSRPHSSSSEAFSHPSWFSLGAISPIELNAFPYRFAQGPMQEAALREYALLRNQIIEQARQSPGSYLSVADCAAKHSTDIVFAASVHAFLECHGIINATTLHIQGPVASSVLQFDELRSSQQERDASSNALSPQALLFDESRGRQPELRTLPQQLSIEQFVCCICASDCFAVRYEGVKHPGMIFCQDCFAKGRFPSDLFSKDFARRYGPLLGPPVGSTAPWTDEEMLALVESIERNGCDWDLVAEDVPSRSSRECAQRFLEMSIAETPRREQTAHTSDDADYKELVGLIVGDCPNPVMSLVHILASGAHPVIAAEAARISLSVLASADAQAESDMKALVLQAAASALKGSCELARIFAEREVTKLKWYVRQLVKEQLNRIAVKIEYLET